MDWGARDMRDTATGQRTRPEVRRTAGRRRLAAWGTWAVLVTLAAPVHAYTVHGKFGIGYEETLTALASGTSFERVPTIRASGLSLIYHVRHWGLEAVLGGHSLIMSGQPTRWSGFVTLGGHYNLFRAPRVNLSAGARVTTGVARDVDETTAKAESLRLGVSVEGPIRAVFFLSDNFAFSAAVGPVLSVNGARGNPLTGQKDSVDISLFRGGFAGGLGFTVFLR